MALKNHSPNPLAENMRDATFPGMGVCMLPVVHGPANGFLFTQGRLRIGEAMSPPLIKGVKTFEDDSEITIIDCPPGTSCPVIEAVKGPDYVALVTEPTPFGLNDLQLALDMVREPGLKYRVIVNRHQEENTSARDFYKERDVSIIAEIPDDRRVAEAYSKGEPAVSAVPRYRDFFVSIWKQIMEKHQMLLCSSLSRFIEYKGDDENGLGSCNVNSGCFSLGRVCP